MTMTPRLPRGHRRRLAEGIFEDRYGIGAIVIVGEHRDEGRFSHETPLADIEAWRLERRAEFLRQRGTMGTRGSLAADIRSFLQSIPAGPTRDDYEDLLAHWRDCPLGLRWRADITELDIRTQLAVWKGQYAPATLRHFVRVLRVLYRRFDGAGAANPTAAISIPRDKRLPRGIPVKLVYRLLENLPDRGQAIKGQQRSTISLTKIRLRVMAWTGMPQMQLERLRHTDVNFIEGKIRLRPRRKGKGAAAVWVSLIPPAVEALRAYAAANLWERTFSRDSMRATWQRTLTRTRKQLEQRAHETGDTSELAIFDAAIPDHCRPYDLRHSFLTEAYRQTGDLRAVAELGQHADLSTTKQYTEGAVSERAEAAIAAMSTRWISTPAPSLTPAQPAPLRAVQGETR